MNFKICSAVFAAIFSITTSASAGTITTIQIGDEDCFGLPGFVPVVAPVCNDGDINPLGIPPIGDYRFGAADNGTQTDIYQRHNHITGVEIDFNVDLTGLTLLSAELEVKVYSLDFAFTTVSLSSPELGGLIKWNGTTELIHNNTSDFRTARIFTINLDPMDVLSGTNTLSVIGDHIDSGTFSDDFAVDYARLTYETRATVTGPMPAVPLPAGGLLLLSGFALLGFRHRRSAKSQNERG